jgi:hypothetical protein
MSNTTIGTSAGANGTWATNVSNATVDLNLTPKGSGVVTYKSFSNDMIVFKGLVEVERAANGFVVRVGTRQGDVATTYVAKDVSEVNGIITAEMVKFKLEDK